MKKINAMREVRREEREGEKAKSSARKVSQHRLRDLNLEAQIVPKCFPKGPSETLWTHLGQPLEIEGLCWEIWGLLGRSLELLGRSLGVPGSVFGALGNDFGRISG